MKVNEISFIDRFIAGSLAALIVGIMAVMAPIAMVVFSRGRGFEVLGMLSSFRAWGSALVVAGWTVGFALGTERVTVLIAHLWGTERPKRMWVTVGLWIALAGIAGMGYWLFGRPTQATLSHANTTEIATQE